jgi:hypothetical protein
MTWDAPAVERARLLWAEGLSAAAIGRELGCSKNSVIGMAHRRGFAPRPSPLARRGPAHWSKTPPVVRALAPMSVPVLALAPMSVPVRLGSRCCCWPMWGDVPAPRPAVFCGEPCSQGPYCPSHDAVAHVPTARGRHV